MRNISEIIVHCTATRPDWMEGKTAIQKTAEIRRWHKGRGWRDIGYHFLIDRDGLVVEGRPVEQVGAHVRGRNAASIGVSLFGGHGSSERDQFGDNFTEAQEASLRGLISTLKGKYGDVAISGHNQWASKACPGFHVPSWYDGRSSQRVALPMPAEAQQVIEDADKSPAASTTALTTLLAGLAGAWQWWQSAGIEQQAISAAVVVAALWIFKERVRKARLGKLAKRALGL